MPKSNLKTMFSAMKHEGYVIKPLDIYLMNIKEDQDRVLNINAPSQVGVCLRARYYARTGEEPDTNTIDPRSRRIFDNGHHVHERLQEYLTAQGILKMSEVPVHNSEYQIQGHTDGILDLPEELAVLEIKSINTKDFVELKDAKEEHKRQGLVYLYCLETHRKYLRNKYRTQKTFDLSRQARKKKYTEMYQHLKDGNKHTREQKINYQVKLHLELDRILRNCEVPLTKAIFLYEDKNKQDLKEFVVDWKENNITMGSILNDYELLNKAVENQKIPDREGTGKSDYNCRWCSYKDTCWVV